MSGVVLSPEEFGEYYRRVTALRGKFEQLGRGASSRAGEDCSLSPSRVSNILTAKYHDVKALELLEVWADEALKEKVPA